MLVNIHIKDDEGNDIFLGAVIPPRDKGDVKMQRNIQRLWSLWREQVLVPEADSDFILWLVCHYEYREPETRIMNAFLDD